MIAHLILCTIMNIIVYYWSQKKEEGVDDQPGAAPTPAWNQFRNKDVTQNISIY